MVDSLEVYLIYLKIAREVWAFSTDGESGASGAGRHEKIRPNPLPRGDATPCSKKVFRAPKAQALA